MMTEAFYDRQGQPMNLFAWARAYSDYESRLLRRTEISEGVEVITVWQGVDGDPLHLGPPLIFGSVLRTGPHQFSDEVETATEEAALRAHEELVEIARLSHGR